ncbi:MAG: VOC family protein [Tepidiformaceae bacterium]
MRLRQIALVAAHLDPVVDDLCAVLGIDVAFKDPAVGKYGLENAVMPIGDTFLEVVAPTQPGTTAGRYIERRGGDGGYMVILQSDDLEADRRRVAELGIRVVEQIDLPNAHGTHLHPRDLGGAILSLDAMEPAAAWEWAGPAWRDHVRIGTTSAITAADIQSADPRPLAERWAKVLACAARETPDGAEIQLDGGLIRFVAATDGRGEGVGAIDVAAPGRDGALAAARRRGLPVDGNTVTICGTRIRLRAA